MKPLTQESIVIDDGFEHTAPPPACAEPIPAPEKNLVGAVVALALIPFGLAAWCVVFALAS